MQNPAKMMFCFAALVVAGCKGDGARVDPPDNPARDSSSVETVIRDAREDRSPMMEPRPDVAATDIEGRRMPDASVVDGALAGQLDGNVIARDAAAVEASPATVLPILVVKVSDTSSEYATFQSHNQKVVENAHGIFMTYAIADGPPAWRLARSTDGGVTFRTIHEGSMLEKVPGLETDEAGSLYVIQPDKANRTATFLRFDPSKNYADPFTKTIPDGGRAAWKFATFYDSQRKRIYYATVLQFFILDLEGTVVQSRASMFADGPHGETAQYPQFAMDGSNLYLAWTNSKAGGGIAYFDIHWMASTDGGVTWRVPGGPAIAIPVVVDDTGPAPAVSLPDEAGLAPRGPWLKNFVGKGGKLHFAYSQFALANGRQHYVRFNQADAKKEHDIYPTWQGAKIKVAQSDGFFATRSDPGAPLYAIMHTPDNRIGVLVSDDLGTTWQDHALSAPLPGSMYGLSGARSIVNGHITGHVAAAGSVWSFRVRAR